MRSQLALLAAVATVSATAIPGPVIKRQDPLTNDPNGNIKVIFSDETVKIGTVKIDDIMAGMYDACSTEGQCDTKTFELNGQIHGGGLGGETTNIVVKVDPSGAFPTWIHNGLLEGLAAAVKAVAKCEDVTTTPTCPNPMVFCPAEPFTSNLCTVPRYWGINYQAKDAGNSAPPFIGTDLDVEVDEGGFCGTLTESLSAVAGAISGVGGGIFTLLGLVCKD